MAVEATAAAEAAGGQNVPCEIHHQLHHAYQVVANIARTRGPQPVRSASTLAFRLGYWATAQLPARAYLHMAT